MTSRSFYLDISPGCFGMNIGREKQRFVSWIENSLPAVMFNELCGVIPRVRRREHNFEGLACMHFHCIPTAAARLMDDAFITASVKAFALDIQYIPDPLYGDIVDYLRQYHERIVSFRSNFYARL
jgi:hypothetical protein